MIDLSYKKPEKKTESNTDYPPIFQFLLLLPFAVLFWVVLTASFLHGI